MYECSKCRAEYDAESGWCECNDGCINSYHDEFLDDCSDKELLAGELNSIAFDAKRIYGPTARVLVVVYEENDDSCGNVVFDSGADIDVNE